MPIPAIVPNPFDDDAQREARLEANLPATARRSIIILVAGCIALLGALAMPAFGLPGADLALVPLGLLLVLGGGIELLLSRL